MDTPLRDLFLIKLQALYDIESELIKVLPKMAKKASDEGLATAFEDHLRVTEGQKERLETIFEMLGEKPKKLRSEAIRGLVEDASWVMKQKTGPEVMDAALASSARYTEHYEMAGYLSAMALADALELDDIADLLAETLAEEEEADEELAELAENAVTAALEREEEEMGDDGAEEKE